MAANEKTKTDLQEQKTQEQGKTEQKVQRRQIRFTEDGVKTLYSSIFNIGFGVDEVVFIFGNQSVDPNVVRIETKVAMSLKAAKRLAVSLSDLIRRYEARNGVIDISVKQRVAADDKIIQ
jgi:hypothetical protein